MFEENKAWDWENSV
jgi:hypothetical protein